MSNYIKHYGVKGMTWKDHQRVTDEDGNYIDQVGANKGSLRSLDKTKANLSKAKNKLTEANENSAYNTTNNKLRSNRSTTSGNELSKYKRADRDTRDQEVIDRVKTNLDAKRKENAKKLSEYNYRREKNYGSEEVNKMLLSNSKKKSSGLDRRKYSGSLSKTNYKVDLKDKFRDVTGSISRGIRKGKFGALPANLSSSIKKKYYKLKRSLFGGNAKHSDLSKAMQASAVDSKRTLRKAMHQKYDR